MAQQGGGISGLAVAMAAAGAVLVYVGIRGVDFRTGLRTFGTGKLPTSQGGSGGAIAAAEAERRGAGGTAGTRTADGAVVGSGPHPEFARAALARRGETYSQGKRWQTGFSDCSSFVGKVLKDNGIEPPAGSVTGSYLVWTKLKRITRAEIGAGDLLCGTGHIAIALDNATAIGQQREGVNVRVGPIDDIMYGNPGWFPQRYVG